MVVKNGNILAVGWNVDINQPAQMSEEHIKTGASIHAEVRALSVVGNPKGVTIYVARINKKGEVRNSRPCVRCESVLESFSVKRVVHT